MEFCCCDDFRQLLHIRWLDIHDIEALILNIEVPKIDAQVVAADKGLAIAVHGNAVDVVCVGVGIRLLGDCSDHGVMMRHSRQLEVRG